MQTNYYTYYNDPLVLAAKSILEGKEADVLDEGVEEIKKAVEALSVGDKTNFGVVKKIDANSITFKAKDLPETKIGFGQRKTGSKDYVLDKLTKMKEDVTLEEEKGSSAHKEILNYATKIGVDLKIANVIYNGMVDSFDLFKIAKSEQVIMVKNALDAYKKIKGGKKESFNEGIDTISKTVGTLKVGDKTNFGVVVSIGTDNITFKAKDLPKTKISFGQRKTGSKDYVLDKLTKMESVSSSDDIPLLDEEFISAMNDQVNGYSLGEAAGANPSSPQLLKADYILFLDNQELYQISPSRSTKMIGTSKDAAKLPVTAWTRVNLATGEDVSELGLGKVSTDELGSWFIVGTKFPQSKAHPALVGTK